MSNGSNGANSNGAKGNGNKLAVAPADPVAGLAPLDDFPASTRVYLQDGDLRVPVRRIEVGGGEKPIDVYDTFGPRAADLHQGLPKLRQPWIAARIARGDTNFSQMHYARRGEITPEMRFVGAARGLRRPSSCATRSRAAARSFRRTSTIPRASR